MNNKLSLLKLTFLLLSVLSFTQVSAATPAARVLKVQGEVEVQDESGKRLGSAKSGTVLNIGDSLHASDKGMAAMQSKAGDLFVVDSGAALRVKDNHNTYEHLVGKILYFFRSKKIVERKVNVSVVTIGIRGTTFLVDADTENTAIGLKEGKLDIATSDEGFNVYQQKTQSEFETYKNEATAAIQREHAEFEKYRTQQTEEFVAFQKSVSLKEQQSLSITGDKATIGDINPSTTDAINRLDSFASGL